MSIQLFAKFVYSLNLAIWLQTWLVRVEDFKKLFSFDHSYPLYILRVRRADKIWCDCICLRSNTICINSTITEIIEHVGHHVKAKCASQNLERGKKKILNILNILNIFYRIGPAIYGLRWCEKECASITVNDTASDHTA